MLDGLVSTHWKFCFFKVFYWYETVFPKLLSNLNHKKSFSLLLINDMGILKATFPWAKFSTILPATATRNWCVTIHDCACLGRLVMRQKIEMIQSDPRPKVVEASKKGAISLSFSPLNVANVHEPPLNNWCEWFCLSYKTPYRGDTRNNNLNCDTCYRTVVCRNRNIFTVCFYFYPLVIF
jgi:hypothetical protein